MSCVLYKREAAWNLPSLSVGCIQAEALLRFSGAEFMTVVQTEPGSSPTGLHPAFEKDQQLAPKLSEDCTEFDCVRSIQITLKATVCDLDAHLTNAQRTVMNAMTKMIQQDLEPATLATMWHEPESYAVYKKAHGGTLPFPLNEVVAYADRKRLRKLLPKNINSDDIFASASVVLDSIASFLEGNASGDYLFGNDPSSLDAILLGHLLFYRYSPCTVPHLQRKVYRMEVLMKYMDNLCTKYFADVIPTIQPFNLRQEEDEAHEMKTAWESRSKSNESWTSYWGFNEWSKLDKMSKWWLSGAAVLLIGYAFIKPPFFVRFGEGLNLADDEYED